jgi:PAS domain S-box-containing protein
MDRGETGHNLLTRERPLRSKLSPSLHIPSPSRTALFICLAVFSVEYLAGYLFNDASVASTLSRAAVDTILLSLILLPFFYRLVYRPSVRRQLRLDLSRTRYRDMFNSIHDPIIIADQQRIIVDVNQPATRKVLGYETSDLVGQSDRVIYADAASFGKAGELVFNKPEAAGQIMSGISYRRKDGTTFPAETNALKLVTEQGLTVGNLAVVRDISEIERIDADKRHLEQQLQQAQKMEAIAQLTGGIAHDFNNTLQIIFGYSEVMAAQLQPDNPLIPLNNRVLEAADKAAFLTRSLMAFSRKQEMQFKPVDLNPLIESFANFLCRTIGAGIELQFNPCAESLVILADPGQLKQTFLNLATNAREAMPEGGQLGIQTSRFTLSDSGSQTLGIESFGDYARIEISDTGHGIPPELIDRIFEPFITTKEVGKGSGLGLTMAFGIVKQHNGYLQVSSQLGVGTSFTIELPLLDESDNPALPSLDPVYGD